MIANVITTSTAVITKDLTNRDTIEINCEIHEKLTIASTSTNTHIYSVLFLQT